MRRFCVSICLALLAFGFPGASVDADWRFFSGPLSGTVVVTPLGDRVSNSATLKLEGHGFQVVARETDSGAVDALIACLPCVPGDRINLSALFANDDLGEGTASVGDERVGNAYVSGYLSMVAGTVQVPEKARASLSLSAPFRLDDGGELQIYRADWARVTREPEQVWARGSVSGFGRATVYLTLVRTSDAIAYLVDRVRYTFEAPANEERLPTGVALLGTLDGSDRPTGH
jgi:hypothetical protein